MAILRPTRQTGEIATTLTIIGVGFLLVGLVLGSFAVKKESQLTPKAQVQCPGGEVDNPDICRNAGCEPVLKETRTTPLCCQHVGGTWENGAWVGGKYQYVTRAIPDSELNCYTNTCTRKVPASSLPLCLDPKGTNPACCNNTGQAGFDCQYPCNPTRCTQADVTFYTCRPRAITPTAIPTVPPTVSVTGMPTPACPADMVTPSSLSAQVDGGGVDFSWRGWEGIADGNFGYVFELVRDGLVFHDACPSQATSTCVDDHTLGSTVNSYRVSNLETGLYHWRVWAARRLTGRTDRCFGGPISGNDFYFLAQPTTVPVPITTLPTQAPTLAPTVIPTIVIPTGFPTAIPQPTLRPTVVPTARPTPRPTLAATAIPTPACPTNMVVPTNLDLSLSGNTAEFVWRGWEGIADNYHGYIFELAKEGLTLHDSCTNQVTTNCIDNHTISANINNLRADRLEDGIYRWRVWTAQGLPGRSGRCFGGPVAGRTFRVGFMAPYEVRANQRWTGSNHPTCGVVDVAWKFDDYDLVGGDANDFYWQLQLISGGTVTGEMTIFGRHATRNGNEFSYATPACRFLSYAAAEDGDNGAVIRIVVKKGSSQSQPGTSPPFFVASEKFRRPQDCNMSNPQTCFAPCQLDCRNIDYTAQCTNIQGVCYPGIGNCPNGTTSAGFSCGRDQGPCCIGVIGGVPTVPPVPTTSPAPTSPGVPTVLIPSRVPTIQPRPTTPPGGRPVCWNGCLCGDSSCDVDILKRYFSGTEQEKEIKARKASAICQIESSSDPRALNAGCTLPKGNAANSCDYSVGLFQINCLARLGPTIFPQICPASPPHQNSCTINDTNRQQINDCVQQWSRAEDNIREMVRISNNGTCWSCGLWTGAAACGIN